MTKLLFSLRILPNTTCSVCKIPCSFYVNAGSTYTNHCVLKIIAFRTLHLDVAMNTVLRQVIGKWSFNFIKCRHVS
jgi:hypothetical protein